MQGGRNEDVPGGLSVGVHGDGHQLQGHGCDTLHPDGKVGQSLQPKNIIMFRQTIFNWNFNISLEIKFSF